MAERSTRREYLCASTATGLVAITGGSSIGSDDIEADESDDFEPIDVRGAVYLPTRAFNWYQMWRWYDPDVVERDLEYASRVNLNALRVGLSYEFWRENPGAVREAHDHFLETARRNGIRVVMALFESVGIEPNRENLTDADPVTGTPVQSPSRELLLDRSRWDEARQFVEWFTDVYGDDDRVLAVEVMNEPGWLSHKKEFARSMFSTMGDRRGSVPLTVGSTSLANNSEFVDWGSDVLQFHYNFASNRGDFRDVLDDGRALSEDLDCPVWLTEWQRFRSGEGFESEVVGDEWQPNYSSLAPLVRNAGVGNFFWSLMVQPAYVRFQRDQGVLNGLFHEDGTVWSLDDARAIKAMSGDDEFEGEERREWPEWAASVEENAFGDS